MRTILPICAAFLLSSCASAPQQHVFSPEEREHEQQFTDQCRTRTAHVAQQRCFRDVANIYEKPDYPFPDLWDTMWQKRIAIAEAFDRGLITGEQAKAQMSQAIDDATNEGLTRIALHHVTNY